MAAHDEHMTVGNALDLIERAMVPDADDVLLQLELSFSTPEQLAAMVLACCEITPSLTASSWTFSAACQSTNQAPDPPRTPPTDCSDSPSMASGKTWVPE